MAHRNVGRSIPSLKLEQVECHRELRRDHFSQNIFTFEKPLLPDFGCAVITPVCEMACEYSTYSD
jgi:hypothetical protein